MIKLAQQLCKQARRSGVATEWQASPALGALLVTGSDATTFLHNNLTSDVAGLQPDQGQVSACLTRTGAVIGLMRLHRLPDRGQPFPSFLALVDSSSLPALQSQLQKVLFADDVEVENVTDDFRGLVVQGPEENIQRLQSQLPSEALVVPWSLTGDPGWVALMPRQSFPSDLSQQVTDLDMAWFADDDIGRMAWAWLCLEGGWPRAGRDFTPGETILSALGIEQRAVSWNKGCYPGQEVVARIRTYGSVPKVLTGMVLLEPLQLALTDLPAPGQPVVTTEGLKIGAWASNGHSTVWERPVAMAYLDRDHRIPGQRHQVEAGDLEIEVEVVTLPFFTGASVKDRAVQQYQQAVRSFSSGQDEKAMAQLESAVSLDPGLAEAWEALGVILGRRERFHEAIDIFRRLEEIAPEEPMVHTNLSLFYMKLGDKEEAEQQKALATLKKFGSGMTQEEAALRDAAADRERRADAARRQAMYDEVLALDPDDGLALMGMGNAMADQDEYVLAEQYLARARLALQDNSPLHVSHGKVLEKLQRPEDAAQVYRLGVAVAARKGDLMPLRELEHRLFLLEGARG